VGRAGGAGGREPAGGRALKKKVIDIVAPDVPALLNALEGRTVEAGGTKHTLHVGGAVAQRMQTDWRTRFLAVVTNPAVAYLLILLGVYGLLFEFMNPGLVMPGVVGVIALLIAAYALHLLAGQLRGPRAHLPGHRFHGR